MIILIITRCSSGDQICDQQLSACVTFKGVIRAAELTVSHDQDMNTFALHYCIMSIPIYFSYTSPTDKPQALLKNKINRRH